VPGELPLTGQVLVAAVDAKVVVDGHDVPFSERAPRTGSRTQASALPSWSAGVNRGC
jgi:hypothetical protein